MAKNINNNGGEASKSGKIVISGVISKRKYGSGNQRESESGEKKNSVAKAAAK